MECRDWLRTLWPASYKGVPFYFESDEEEGGRGLVIHKFPNRDIPYVEDLGEEPRFFSGSAYVHGDNVDSLESKLKQALASRGAGMLVVPLGGPVTVQCQTFKRRHERDKLGYVAFEIKFVREGAASALISVPLAQNVAYSAVSSVTRLLPLVFPSWLKLTSESDSASAVVADGISSAAAAIDVVRTSYPVDPLASSAIRDRVLDIVAASVSSPIDPIFLADALVSLTVATADAMPPASAARAMRELAAQHVAVSAPRYLTPSSKIAFDNAAATTRLARLAALSGFAEAVIGKTYASRPDGVSARASVAEVFEAELYDTTGAANASLYIAIDDMRGAVIDFLTRLINDLAPVITVQSLRIVPALAMAWRLYADPLRDAEIVARNRVRHPSFLPHTISVLSR